ncbi:MAG TPA: sigma-70 family RNA polymerase sigma factor [Pseudomonadales bacterium]|nr:sigma-70 family RNA polymerase sigma factor [Pseudomonadales bacterium]
MNLTDSLKLLRDYADRGDEAAFRKLVEQYIDFVYSAAMRRVNGDSALAQDVTQTVFTDLARKAKSLRDVAMLGGWLYRYTGFVASNAVRGERRRQIREQEAAQMNATSESSDALWQQLAPVLDDTIEALEPSDRQAVLLRFFERRDFRAIGAAMGISDDAAQKRVSRALEKLRALLTERGVTLSVVILSGLLASKGVCAAPAELVSKIARIALAGAATQAGLGWTLLHLSRSTTFRIALGGTIAAVALWLYLGYRPGSTNQPKNSLAPTVALAAPTNTLSSNQAPAMPTASTSQNNDTSTTSNVLLLNIVTADSGQPIPNVELDYWIWAKGKVKHKKPLITTRMGVCKVPVPNNTTELMLVSERDGFADTLLDWKTDHGEQIPAQYTLKVNRAVPIGGTVVDPDGHPVSGAEVGFNDRADIASQASPQSDDFSWPYYETATTDSQGHWQINRIGKAAVRHLDGSAKHPDFVLASLESSAPDPTQKQLLDGTYVFTLGRAVVVRGTVKDSGGNPVADAEILVGHVSMNTSRTSKSLGDGTFSIAGCNPERTLLTAQAKGFAATTIKVNLANNSGPYDLVLQPGKTLKLRLVNSNGDPIPKADVWYDAFPNHQYDPNDPEKYAATQVDFYRKTDKNGRLEWDNCPEGDLTFEIAAAGYMRNNEVKVPADGVEHVVTLQQGLTIAGTVVDATTGQPIPKFRIITGWPNIDYSDNTTNAVWSTIDRFWLSFDGGKFQYTYEEQVLGGVKDPTFIFKFEADGYAPFITRVVPATEGSARFDVALTPAPVLEVTVLSTNDQPAAQADVGLVSASSRLSLIPGGFSRGNIQSGGSLLVTDNQGQFQLPPDDTIEKIIVASPQGFAEATPSELAANPTINLLPWGRLEGTYETNGQPLPDRTLSLQYDPKSFNRISCDSAFQAKTDSNGHFTFPQVPPGKRQVCLIVPFNGNMSSGWTQLPLQTVTISAGESATITIDQTNMMAQEVFPGN